MKSHARALGMAAAVLAALAGGPSLAHPDEEMGGSVWRNPSNSVHIRFAACGPNLCGTVVWANEKAKADAERGSGKALLGTRIFRDLRAVKPGTWEGRVHVPDIGASFDGTVTRQGENQLLGEGCLIGRIGCRSQLWTRVSG